MWHLLSTLGPTDGSLEVKSASFGIQAGQLIVPYGTAEVGWEKGRSAKQDMLISGASID
jgi:hypothetical protein